MHHSLPDFPVSTPAMILWALILVFCLLCFVTSLIRLNRKGHRKVIGVIFLFLLAAATAIHVVLLSRSSHTVTDGNWIQLVLVSAAAALEMFIGHTVVFDDIIAAVIFREPLLLLAYVSIFLFVLTYTLSIALLIVPRRLRDRTWLRMHRREAGQKRKNHIFLGINQQSKHLAYNILKEDRSKGGMQMIFVEFPDAHSHKSELSIGELISNIFGREKERTLEDELGSDAFVLFKGKMPREKTGHLGKALSLDKLEPWLCNSHSNVYILSDNEEDNFALLKAVKEDKAIAAKVFYYAHSSLSYESLVCASMDHQRIRLLDPHYLSFMQLKLEHPELMPVHFVDKALNAKGEPLGYVNQGLQAMIVGFADSGQEALRFLYEYGSFVGKDRLPAPMSIRIVDPAIQMRKGQFLSQAPAMRSVPGLEWSADAAGEDNFWQDFDARLDSLQYVVIGMDQGRKNVELGIAMLQKAARVHKDLSRFVILMRGSDTDSETLRLIDYYNRAYCPQGVQVLRVFGRGDDIWKSNNISGKSLKEASIHYLNAYRDAGLVRETWDERKLRLTKEGSNPLESRKELRRRQAMDISRALYVNTLQEFATPGIREAARDIPAVYEDNHYPQKGHPYTHLSYLAAQEHQHWMAALQVSGYTDGAVDELRQTHNNMVPFPDIRKPEDAHISWLAVKIALTDSL